MHLLHELVRNISAWLTPIRKNTTPAFWLPFLAGTLVAVFFAYTLIPGFSGYVDELGVTGASETVRIDETPQETETNIENHTVKSGQSIYTILRAQGITPLQIHEISQQLKGKFSPRSLRPGKAYETEKDLDGTLLRFSYYQDRATVIHVARGSAEEAFHAEKEMKEYSTRTVALEGMVEQNLSTSLSARGRAGLLPGMKKLLSSRVDFRRDIPPGSTYRVLFEEQWLEDSFISSGRILAVELTLAGTTYSAYRYMNAKGEEGYYDERGRSVERIARFAAPCRYRRVSSLFGYRVHPIFRTRHFHGGVDLAAPTGTPVRATAAGKVIFKGPKGGAGNMITLSHPGGYHSQYLHLSRYAVKTRYGARVKQGDIIGYVGSTGNSTGAHLDFRIIHNGKHLNPLTQLRKTSSRIVVKAEMANFLAEVSLLKAKLDDRSILVAGSGETTNAPLM
ncbi:peptidoglycan DD-metalloendopeptidase family protein [Chlorobium sp. N1]|uniref:M23 family metallopeptidase n=1 Tax=Chlorobium sp. N1 TaxID=2491138 RepID=UPI00103DF5EF|nr:peptidoglycan DD-metalloendopeptidase family protein [Chlorobium sp. N1]TCD47826.1 M23 family peptidase [Chlorobium sp. N1]